ncbi:hypothetical protein CEXT_659471 [Caerostris extrusa]|uniref:Uncharacterized protein n=1 Tax=Caerostris extrusa TaxID=172846 RepID=A0AAV4RT80_CAEEX|nr:hypothetical protein CEXT_659471 [Caerostris extrusa]
MLIKVIEVKAGCDYLTLPLNYWREEKLAWSTKSLFVLHHADGSHQRKRQFHSLRLDVFPKGDNITFSFSKLMQIRNVLTQIGMDFLWLRAVKLSSYVTRRAHGFLLD